MTRLRLVRTPAEGDPVVEEITTLDQIVTLLAPHHTAELGFDEDNRYLELQAYED